MQSVEIVADKQKKKFSRKTLLVLSFFVLVLLVAAVVIWFASRPITLDRPLVERAVTAISNNDAKQLTAVSDIIRKISRFETSPEYLTILTIDAMRNKKLVEASGYFKQLKALGNYTYVDYVPWKDKERVLASFEHDINLLDRKKNGSGVKASSGGG